MKCHQIKCSLKYVPSLFYILELLPVQKLNLAEIKQQGSKVIKQRHDEGQCKETIHIGDRDYIGNWGVRCHKANLFCLSKSCVQCKTKQQRWYDRWEQNKIKHCD